MKLIKVQVTKIEKLGIEKTYDMTVDSPYHSYIANGFVVHNSLHSGQTAQYCLRHLGKEEITYSHPLLEPITKDTHGLILYQEQVMEVMYNLGKFSWATAESTRKIMTKSAGKKEFEKMRNEFCANANKHHNLTLEEAGNIFDVVSTFGSYGFNKCVSGDTTILTTSEKTKAMKRMKLKDAYKNNIKEIFSFNPVTKKSFVCPVKEIVKTGMKPVYTVVCENNRIRKIKTTLEHKFLTETGWKELKELKVGDKVMTKQPSTLLYKEQNPSCGSVPWNKGINYDAPHNVLPDEYTREKMSISAKERETDGHTGCKHSEETKQFIRNNTLRMMKEGKIPQTQTSVHKLVWDAMYLTDLSKGFENEYNFKNKFNIDIANPEKKIAIEVQGDYWHANPKFYHSSKLNGTQRSNVLRDKIKKRMLEKEGWVIIYLWENEINSSLGKCLYRIKAEINDTLENPWGYEEIKKIFYSGVEETYDVHVDDDNHNYIADMFVVHNSHAVEYSVISYWCAWLKTYYTAEFFATLLTHSDDGQKTKDYINDMKEYGLTVNLPNINKSKLGYQANEGKLYAGIDTIRGIGEKVASKIIAGQPYSDINDFLQKVHPGQKLLESLALSGCFDEWKLNLKHLVENSEEIAKKKSVSQNFLIPFEDYTEKELQIQRLKYIDLETGKPLIDMYHDPFAERLQYTKINTLNFDEPKSEVWIKGIITFINFKQEGLEGNWAMFNNVLERRYAHLNIADGTGSVLVHLSPEQYTYYKKTLERDTGTPVIIKGHTLKEITKIYCDAMIVMDDINPESPIVKCLNGVALENLNKVRDLMGQFKSGIIKSASYKVSKNKNPYARIELYDNPESILCLQLTSQLFTAGEVLVYDMQTPPFIRVIARR